MNSTAEIAGTECSYYVGIAGLPIGFDELDFGNGVRIRAVYAHLFANFVMAFARPAPGKPHPGPWKATQEGTAIDITGEIAVSQEAVARFGSAEDIARAVVFALRVGVSPVTFVAAISNAPFRANIQTASDKVWIAPAEVESKFFPLINYNSLREPQAMWVAARWPTVLRLTNESAEFALAVDALTVGQFVHRSALTMTALWAALESLFSPSTSELRFRISSLIAAFLISPGEQRRNRAAEIAKLYDKRSAAVHGVPKHNSGDVLATFLLLQEVVLRMLDAGRVPTKDELADRLFGVEREPPEHPQTTESV